MPQWDSDQSINNSSSPAIVSSLLPRIHPGEDNGSAALWATMSPFLNYSNGYSVSPRLHIYSNRKKSCDQSWCIYKRGPRLYEVLRDIYKKKVATSRRRRHVRFSRGAPRRQSAKQSFCLSAATSTVYRDWLTTVSSVSYRVAFAMNMRFVDSRTFLFAFPECPLWISCTGNDSFLRLWWAYIIQWLREWDGRELNDCSQQATRRWKCEIYNATHPRRWWREETIKNRPDPSTRRSCCESFWVGGRRMNGFLVKR